MLKDYLSNFDPHRRGLTPATPLRSTPPSRHFASMKVPLEGGDYTMDHTAVVYLMDKNGRFVTPNAAKPTAGAGRRARPGAGRHAYEAVRPAALAPHRDDRVFQAEREGTVS